MKKLILNVIFIVIIAFLLPILFTKQFRTTEVYTKEVQEVKKVFDYGEYNTIKLLHIQTGIVESLPLDTYLYGVVAAEMPASYELEALKAQATVARTYTIYKIVKDGKHENADICDNAACCQAWISKENRFARWEPEECEQNWSKIVAAVDSTVRKLCNV